MGFFQAKPFLIVDCGFEVLYMSLVKDFKVSNKTGTHANCQKLSAKTQAINPQGQAPLEND
jgi:hypothetical protein